MNWVDYSILVIIGVSVVISLFRGFTRETLALAGWAVALWVALNFTDNLEAFLRGDIEVGWARRVVAFALLFFIALILAFFVNHLAVQLVRKTGLSGTDRMVGIFFGIARGCLVIALLVLVGGMTPLPQEFWWKQSLLLRYFQDIALWLRHFLPPELAQSVRYG